MLYYGSHVFINLAILVQLMMNLETTIHYQRHHCT